MEAQFSMSDGGQSARPQGSTAEEDFCRSLPQQEPIAAQVLLCGELLRVFSNRQPGERELGALLVLDRYAHQISKRLLLKYAEGDAQLRSLDREFFISAQRLSRSFGEAYEVFLGRVENPVDDFWRGQTGTILVNLFRHRESDLLLRLFRYKKRNSEQWRQLHAIYALAQAHGVVNDDSSAGATGGRPASGPTLEQQFIRILLLGALGTGQFSPRELVWARDWIGRWHRSLSLRPANTLNRPHDRRDGYVVDLRSAEGLRRTGAGEAGDFLHLDTAPLTKAIEQEMAVLKDLASAPDSAALPEQESRRALLSRLDLLLAPAPVHTKRRGERESVALPVQTISSLPHVVQMLREEAQRKSEQSAASAAQLEDITISPTSGHTRILTSMSGAQGFAALSIETAFGARINAWQIKDRSDSGCRMRGQTNNLNNLIPGSLITMRENEGAPWTVAVVRRLRRLMVDHLEISVEYIGRRPRFVKMVTDHKLAPLGNDAPGGAQKCFGALYLPASDKHPTMPIKTLLVPASVFNAGRYVTLLSSSATYSLRLNKPLEQQSEFVWTSFAVLEKAVAASGSPSLDGQGKS